MKKDLNDLKSLVNNLISSNDLEIGEGQSFNPALPRLEEAWSPVSLHGSEEEDQPIIVSKDDADDAIILEDNLSLEDMDKIMIRKALEKHNGRRKDAAKELGISERTLYRKINQYEI